MQNKKLSDGVSSRMVIKERIRGLEGRTMDTTPYEQARKKRPRDLEGERWIRPDMNDRDKPEQKTSEQSPECVWEQERR